MASRMSPFDCATTNACRCVRNRRMRVCSATVRATLPPTWSGKGRCCDRPVDGSITSGARPATAPAASPVTICVPSGPASRRRSSSDVSTSSQRVCSSCRRSSSCARRSTSVRGGPLGSRLRQPSPEGRSDASSDTGGVVALDAQPTVASARDSALTRELPALIRLRAAGRGRIHAEPDASQMYSRAAVSAPRARGTGDPTNRRRVRSPRRRPSRDHPPVRAGDRVASLSSN